MIPRRPVLYALLVAIALFGPMIAFAGVSVVWPGSPFTVDVDETPPITFAAGEDHAQAQTIGFANALTTDDNAGSFSLSLFGLSGGSVTIDRFVNITKLATVSEFRFEATNTISGIAPDTLKARFWTGATPPTSDGDAQVCAVLDMTTTGESTTACSGGTVQMQVIYALPSSQTTESDIVTIRPSSIVFA